MYVSSDSLSYAVVESVVSMSDNVNDQCPEFKSCEKLVIYRMRFISRICIFRVLNSRLLGTGR